MISYKVHMLKLQKHQGSGRNGDLIEHLGNILGDLQRLGIDLRQDEDLVTRLDGDLFIFQIALLDLAEGAITMPQQNMEIDGFLGKVAVQMDLIDHCMLVVHQDGV